MEMFKRFVDDVPVRHINKPLKNEHYKKYFKNWQDNQVTSLAITN